MRVPGKVSFKVNIIGRLLCIINRDTSESHNVYGYTLPDGTIYGYKLTELARCECNECGRFGIFKVGQSWAHARLGQEYVCNGTPDLSNAPKWRGFNEISILQLGAELKASKAGKASTTPVKTAAKTTAKPPVKATAKTTAKPPVKARKQPAPTVANDTKPTAKRGKRKAA